MLFNLLGVFCWNMLRTPFRRPSSPAVISSFTSESGGPSGPRPCANNDSELGNLGIIETNVVLCREPNPHASTQKHSQFLLDRCRDVLVFQGRQADSGKHGLLVSEFVCFVLCAAPSPPNLSPASPLLNRRGISGNLHFHKSVLFFPGDAGG